MKRSKEPVRLFAWVCRGNGEPELGQAIAHGWTPLVAVRRDKVDRDVIRRQLQEQADLRGENLYLITCAEVDTLRVIRPRGSGTDTP